MQYADAKADFVWKLLESSRDGRAANAAESALAPLGSFIAAEGVSIPNGNPAFEMRSIICPAAGLSAAHAAMTGVNF